MQWIHHDDVVKGKNSSLKRGQEVLRHLTKESAVHRLILESNLGADVVPTLPRWQEEVTLYAKAWFSGHPVLTMKVHDRDLKLVRVDVWFSREARAAWRIEIDGDTSVAPPRRIVHVQPTADDSRPYVISGTSIRRWNASQDLPKQLVGATKDDPDGNVFLTRLGGRRWRPITHALVAEMVKDARRPVPEPTGSRRYQSVSLGEGQMIRYGANGPVWLDADAAVHLAGLAGYPLGDPNEVSSMVGGEGWSRLWDIAPAHHAVIDDIAADLVHAYDIAYAAFASEIGADELKRVFPAFRWGRGGRHGERLRDVQDARYSRMLYHGHPVIRATVGEAVEVWLSTAAHALVIAAMSPPAEPDALPSAPIEPRLRKHQRKALAKLAKAIRRLGDEGLVLVMQAGVLKARLEDDEDEKEGLVTVLPDHARIPTID